MSRQFLGGTILSSEWTVKVFKTGEKEWNEIIEQLPGKNIYITEEYSRLFEKHFCDEALLFVFGDDKNFIVHPVWKRKIDSKYFDVMSPWYHAGPTMKAEAAVQEKLAKEFLAAFHDYCVKNSIVSEFVRFYPVTNNHKLFANILEIKKAGDVVIVDTNRTAEEMFNSFSKVCRKNIRRATKSGVKVFASTKPEDIQKFFDIYSKSMERKEAEEFYKFSLDFFKDLFNLLKGEAVMLFAEHDSQIIVGNIVLHKYEIAEDYLRGFDPSFSSMRPNNMLVFEMAKWCSKNGCKVMNLGGSHTSTDELFRFKSSFSKKTAEYFVSGVVHNQKVYDLLCKKKENTAGLDYFPLYR